MNIIDCFDEGFEFLSNFYPCKVKHEGVSYLSSEAAFQAAKTTDIDLRRRTFSNLSAGGSKRMGRHIPLRNDWESVKERVMYEILKDKFTRNPDLRESLIATDNRFLVEGNYWHDNTWGNCNCEKCSQIVGLNKLGLILMQVRDELNKEETE